MRTRNGGMKKHMDKLPSGFKIQITSMVDMFVILLVFLLKTYSTSPVNITPQQGLRLPESTATTDPVDVVKLVVSKDGMFVEDDRVVEMAQGQLPKGSVDDSDPQFIRTLYEALDKHAQKAKSIASVNESFEFDGKVMMQVDRELPYELLQKVMYTSMLAGYSDVKLAVVSK